MVNRFVSNDVIHSAVQQFALGHTEDILLCLYNHK